MLEGVAFCNKNAFVENNINFYADSDVKRDSVLCDIKTKQQKCQSGVKCGPHLLRSVLLVTHLICQTRMTLLMSSYLGARITRKFQVCLTI